MRAHSLSHVGVTQWLLSSRQRTSRRRQNLTAMTGGLRCSWRLVILVVGFVAVAIGGIGVLSAIDDASPRLRAAVVTSAAERFLETDAGHGETWIVLVDPNADTSARGANDLWLFWGDNVECRSGATPPPPQDVSVGMRLSYREPGPNDMILTSDPPIFGPDTIRLDC